MLLNIIQDNVSATFASSSSSSCPVNECIDIIYGLLDNYIYIIDVETSRCHICSDKNHFRIGPTELFENPHSLILLQVTLNATKTSVVVALVPFYFDLGLGKDENFEGSVLADKFLDKRLLGLEVFA